MNLYIISAAIIGGVPLIALKPRVQILIAFIIMTDGFDMLPRLILNQHIWDYGAVLLLLFSTRLFLMKKVNHIKTEPYIMFLKVFLIWLVFCFIWSIIFFDYSVLQTIQVSRQLMIGYFSFFIFIRLFSVDKNALGFMLNAFYIITFILLVIAVIQNVFNMRLLYGLYSEYGDANRYLPVFLTICFFYFWVISARLLSAEKINKHSIVYILLVLVVMALTYTRGIYLSFLMVFIYMMWILIKQNKIRMKSTMPLVGIFIMIFSIILISGVAGRVINRFLSGIDLVTSGAVSTNIKSNNKDTFTGRLLLVKERFELVFEHNAVLGYGFLHTENVPEEITKSLKYGSVNRAPKYKKMYKWGAPYILQFYSVDIGWADIVLKTGYIGFLLFIIFLISIYTSYFKKRIVDSPDYYLKLGAYLQLVMFLPLMFNGNPLIELVQVPMFMLAVYAYINRVTRVTDFKPLMFEAA